MTEGIWGAYGLRLQSTIRPEDGLRSLQDPLATLRLSQVVSRAIPQTEYVGPGAAAVVMAEGTHLAVRQDSPTHFAATLTATTRLNSAELLHPYLAPIAALCHRWMGRPALHAASVARDETTLVLVGERLQGKSTTAAALVRAGWSLVSDDLVVMHDRGVLAGPRSIDLRSDAHLVVPLGSGFAARLGRHRELTPEVWALPPLPVTAFLHLEFGPTFAVERMAAQDRLTSTASQLYWPTLGSAAPDLLSLIEFDHVRLSRSRSPEGLRETVEWAERLAAA